MNVALASLLGGCGDGADPFPENGRVAAPIIGGSLVGAGEFAAVVALGGCSGTLVHPRLVVYAAHCGTAISSVRFGIDANAPEHEVHTDRCRAFPSAKLGDGTDLAYCVLREPVLDIEPERILAGCELDDFAVSEPALIVGYGKDSDDADYGVKRFATSRLESIGDELFLEEGATDTCRGDSGGPVFVERVDPDGSVRRRLVGVTSAGTESRCGHGTAHYVNLIPKLSWLEAQSQLDLTPCFDQGEWAPTAACGTASCGDAYDPPEDTEPPAVAWTSPAEPNPRLPLSPDVAYAEFELALTASDAGSGVASVEFSLLASDGALLFQRSDEIAPYGLPTFRVPEGHFTLLAEARDFAGNTASEVVSLQVGDDSDDAPEGRITGGGCASVSRAAPAAPAWAAVLPLLIAFIARRRDRDEEPE